MVDFNTNFNPTLNKNFSGRQQQLRNTDFNKDFSAALRGQQPPAPRLNMGNLSSLPNQMPNQMPAPGQTQNISPYEVEQKDIVRSPQEEQALEDSFRIEAQRYADKRERDERSDYGQDRGLLGAIYSGIVNKMRRGEKLTRYEEEEYNRLSAKQQVADSDAVRGFQKQTATTSRETLGAPQRIRRFNPELNKYEYKMVQLGNRGTLSEVDLDDGWEPDLSAATYANDAYSIRERRDAERAAELKDITELSTPRANADAETTAAVWAAQTDALVERQNRMYDSDPTRLAALEVTRQEAFSRLSQREEMQEQFNAHIDTARNLSSGWTTGFFGNIASYVPGTDAYDLVAGLDVIKASSGLDKLLSLKEAGGTLGQVTEAEHLLLQKSWANLDNAQSEEAFLRALTEFQEATDRAWRRVGAEYARTYPGDTYFTPGEPENPLPLSRRVNEALALDFSGGGLTNAAGESTASRFPRATAGTSRTVEQIVRGN